jgi:hypothetical protein
MLVLDGAGPQAHFGSLGSLITAPGGNLFVLDGSRIRKVPLTTH